MKKTMILFAMLICLISSCTNSNKTPAVTDSPHTIPADTAKKDTMVLPDTVIKG